MDIRTILIFKIITIKLIIEKEAFDKTETNVFIYFFSWDRINQRRGEQHKYTIPLIRSCKVFCKFNKWKYIVKRFVKQDIKFSGLKLLKQSK